MNKPLSNPVHPEVAFYYPNWMWHSDDAIKNLLLFFDGIALLVPEYMQERPELVVPEIATPLLDKKLLHLLKPEEMIDQEMTEKLVEVLTEIITSGALDSLAKEQTRFQELSYSRLGGSGDLGLSRMIIEELKDRRLARDSEDGVSIPLHPKVRLLVLVILSQILPPLGPKFGLALEPTTDQLKWVDALTEIFSLPSSPSLGNVVAMDIETVGVDLSRVPLDEVLSFRSEHKEDYRRYRRSVKKIVRDLSRFSQDERVTEFNDRIEEIKDQAEALNRQSQQAWSGHRSFGLGIAGFIWSIGSWDLIGAIIGVSALLDTLLDTLLGTRKSELKAHCSYSYLFQAVNRYP